MSEYVIKNGHVFDPVQGIKGDKADVAIKDGKIVAKAGAGAKVIDAKGKTVMAGAVEIHAHIAGPKVNLGRIYRPEDKLFTCTPTKGMERMGAGDSIPTTFKTGYEYAKMGYTTAMEAAMPPLFSRHVHEEIRDTPIIDEGAFPVFGNNWFVMEYLKNQELENTAAYCAWLLRATKGYAIKVVNPGGTEAWAWGLNCLSVNDPVPYFDITPAEIIKGLIEANEYLGLPHSMHIHPNNLGNPGNYTTTLDTLKIAEGFKAKNNIFLNHKPGGKHVHISNPITTDYSHIDMDNNIYYPDGSSSFTWINRTGNFSYWRASTLAAGLTADENSLAEDPLLDAGFRPTSSSPAIDAGVDVGLTSDFEGNPIPMDGDDSGSAEPDMGAYEYQGSTG